MQDFIVFCVWILGLLIPLTSIFFGMNDAFKDLAFYLKRDHGGHESKYHNNVVFAGLYCAVIGSGIGSAVVYLTQRAQTESLGELLFLVLIACYVGFLAGWFIGVSLACGLAPKSFLQAPGGKKWVRLVGTTNVKKSRAVCLILAASITAFCGFLLWVLYQEWITVQQ
jgi:hypothetical protein